MISYYYDPLNRIIGVLDQDYYYIGYSYQADGQKNRITVYELTDTDNFDIIYDVYYEYDLAGRLKNVYEPQMAYGSQTLAAFDYDLNGNRSKLSYYLDGKESSTPVSIGYTYDEDNFLTAYTTAGGPTFSFDAADDPCDPCDYDGIDGLGRLTAAREVLSNDPCNQSNTRTYDLAYSYDLRGQLLTNQMTFDQDPCSTIGHTFGYYDDGNIDTRQVTGESATTFAYTGDLMDGASGQDNFTLGWDENGNMTTGVNPTFVYNWDNKIRSASVSGGDSIDSIKYDPDGNRIYKESTVSSQSVKRKYIVDIVGRLPVILLIMDAGNDNSIVNSYVYANSRVLAQYEGEQKQENAKHFYLHDRLGSVRLLIDESGDVANVYTYKPYGQLIATESAETAANPFKFTGQYYDEEIDQYYLRARQYDPEISRFTSRDPVSGTLAEPMTLHIYLYCSNDPLNQLDPWGLASVALYDGSEIDEDGKFWGERRFESANDFDYFFNVGSVKGAANLLKLMTTWGPLRTEGIDDLYIFDHGLKFHYGENVRQQIGDGSDPANYLNYDSKEWQTIASTINEGGTVHLRGCYVALRPEGRRYIMRLAEKGKVRVDAYEGTITHSNWENWGGPDYVALGNLWEADPSRDQAIIISHETKYDHHLANRRW